MSKARCLLVGLGRVGMGYDIGTAQQEQVMSHARALKLSTDLEFLGAVDPSPETRQLFSENYDRPSYDTLDQALMAISPEVIVIATPTETHLRLIEEVCSVSGLKIILCEKPLAYDMRDAKRIIEICEKSGVQLFVNYMRRVDPPTNLIRETLARGKLGPFVTGACFYSKGLIHNASHFVNLLEFWFGSPTVAMAEFAPGSVSSISDGLLDFDLQFENLQVGFRSLGDIDWSPASLDLWGIMSRLSYNWGGLEIETYDLTTLAHGAGAAEGVSLESSLPHIQFLVAEEVAAALRGQETSLCTGLEALSTLGICIEIFNKARHTIG